MTSTPGLSFGALVHRWRDRLSPVDAGLPRSARRRAPGLRREELAQLVGLSVDYVLRLEQGRANRPSAQVVAAIGRALQLSRAERDQLYVAAGLLPPRDGLVSRHVPPSVQRLTARLGDFPIAVFAADWTLVWWNPVWTALHGDPGELPVSERNLARAVFGAGPARAALRPSWSETGEGVFAAAVVADLREAASRYPGDEQLRALVARLRGESADFERYWATGESVRHLADRKTVRHPEIGDVTLDCDVLLVPDADLRVVTYTAAEGSADAGRLDLLRVVGGQPVTSAS
ncbi:Helix-turn-helix domain-containing protein [Promicromonospora umidemergens]|uniref:Helix-turn-helix transcriptional regulator n=1 Tax=Promicromonospora umidemergens TaxID=629679 RepID=A0ABP8XRB9_9MICO|nr:helix-turn-helix transcriptional regulator [Promicromonospora umidemergens]MCP2286410.1 Helix-turn-helix domain-containing protein [Promicromonospora umidemergens]